MLDTTELKQTLLKMIRTELEAMTYYQQASRFIRDPSAIYHFNLLAQEELEHARSFYSVYPDDDLADFETLARNLTKQQRSLSILHPKRLQDLDECSALQLAIKLEEKVAGSLRQLLPELSSPAARAVVAENLESTLSHLELIREDYQRLFEQQANA